LIDERSDVFGGLGALLWALAFFIVFVAAHAALAYLRLAGREKAVPRRALLAVLSAGALGIAIWSAMVLAISGSTSGLLGYDLGYYTPWLAVAAALPTLTALLAVAMVLQRPALSSVVAAGIVVGVGAMMAMGVLLESLGLQPGIAWRLESILLALPVAGAAAVASFWISLLGGGRAGSRRRPWRWAAAALFGIGIVLGDALGVGAAGFDEQASSDHAAEVPANVAAVAAGVAVPFVLIGALVDLALRRLKPADPNAPRRRRRRMRRPRPLV
jgi:NO-binding membrane sensor protein with MHYT domain